MISSNYRGEQKKPRPPCLAGDILHRRYCQRLFSLNKKHVPPLTLWVPIVLFRFKDEHKTHWERFLRQPLAATTICCRQKTSLVSICAIGASQRSLFYQYIAPLKTQGVLYDWIRAAFVTRRSNGWVAKTRFTIRLHLFWCIFFPVDIGMSCNWRNSSWQRVKHKAFRRRFQAHGGRATGTRPPSRPARSKTFLRHGLVCLQRFNAWKMWCHVKTHVDAEKHGIYTTQYLV